MYQHAGKCDDQQNLKDILDASMVYTTIGLAVISVKRRSSDLHVVSFSTPKLKKPVL